MFPKPSHCFVLLVLAGIATLGTPHSGLAQHGGHSAAGGVGAGHFSGGFGGAGFGAGFGGGNYRGLGGANFPVQQYGGFGGGHFNGEYYGGFRAAPYSGMRYGAGRIDGYNRYNSGYRGQNSRPYGHDQGRYYRPWVGVYDYGYPYYFDYAYPYYGWYGYNFPYYYNDYPYYNDNSYTSVEPTYVPDGEVADVPDQAALLSGNESRAYINVTAPVDAEVWFDGVPTNSTGAIRQFDSPPLSPGRRYTYDVRARWDQNGQEMTQTQHVVVTAGSRVSIKFPAPLKTAQKSSEALVQPPRSSGANTNTAESDSTGAAPAPSEQTRDI
jgi:uncharacterized protein (TIGR03000 family)